MKQTKLHSFWESVNASAIAAPTAMGMHKLFIFIGGDCVTIDSTCNDSYIMMAWVGFFLHSIMWKYFIRRIHEKYHILLNPYNIVIGIKKRMNDYFTQHKHDLKKFYQLYIKSKDPQIKSRATDSISSLVPAEELKKWG